MVSVLGRDRYDLVARRLGDRLRAGLLELQTRHDVIGDVRGRGLLQGIELVTDRTSRNPAGDLGAKVIARCFELGLHLNIVQFPGSSSIFRMAPPLTVSDAELDRGLEILDEALTSVAGPA